MLQSEKRTCYVFWQIKSYPINQFSSINIFWYDFGLIILFAILKNKSDSFWPKSSLFCNLFYHRLFYLNDVKFQWMYIFIQCFGLNQSWIQKIWQVPQNVGIVVCTSFQISSIFWFFFENLNKDYLHIKKPCIKLSLG